VSEIFQFVPRRGLEARDNVRAFIDGCREQLTVFGQALDFDADTWNVTDGKGRRASSRDERISFTAISSARARKPEPMRQPFRDFAKAYIRYWHGLRPILNQHERMAALRVLHDALASARADVNVSESDATMFNRSAELAKRNFSPVTAYKVGVQLERLARFLDESRLVSAPLSWRNPLKRPLQGTRVGADFDARRRASLPSANSLAAVATAFNRASETNDVLVASAAAVLCSCPARVCELLTLPADCEAAPPVGDRDFFGLRWWPAKGHPPQIKWIIPSMVEVVRRALSMIRTQTEAARRVAAWYERHPTKLYLREELRHLRYREWLSYDEVTQILGGASGKGFCLNRRLQTRSSAGRTFVSFRAVERAVLRYLPKDFPVFDRASRLPYSQALFVVPLSQFRQGTQAPMTCMIRRVEVGQINTGLGTGIRHGKSSLFSRLDVTEPDGSPIVLRSHQFRHYLNTLAQIGGASQLDIATWSGRRDVRQNAAYDHESASDVLARVRSALATDRWHGPLADVGSRSPVPREEFARLAVPTAHTTDIGFCLHDYAMTPCQLHLDCIHCTEHVCIKGDAEKTQLVRSRLGEARLLLARARPAMNDRDFGSDRWFVHHASTVERLESLLRILEDPSVPHGSVVQLGSRSLPSAIRVAAEIRGQGQRRQLTSRRKRRGEAIAKPE
jgi:hypothetical protein